jgi:hypothetical protein
MSDVAAAAKSAKSSAAPAAQAKPAQTLREVQPKRFAPSSLQSIGQDFDILAVSVPADWTFEDVLKPVAWSNVAPLVAKDALNTRRDKIGSLIYVRSASGAFKAILSIEGITLDQFGKANGLKVEPWIK